MSTRRARNLVEILEEHQRDIGKLRSALARSSLRDHTHDDRYYTEGEVDTLLSGKSSTSHTHSYLPLSGGTLTGNLFITSNGVYLTQNSNSFLSKSGSGNLYIDQAVTGGAIFLRADDAGSTIRNRMLIDGDGYTYFYDQNGAARTWVRDPHANGATTVREGGALVVGGDQLGTTVGNIARAASFRLNNGNNQTLEVQAVRYSSGSGWGSARLGFRLITDSTDHGSMWFVDNKIIMHSTDIYGSAKLQVAGGLNMIPATSAGSTVYMVSVGGGRYALTNTSSVLRSKTVEDDSPDLADYDLRPVRFKTKESGDVLYGFVADWLAEQDELLGVYDHEGTLENYHDRGVLAILAAKVNRSEAMHEATEARLARLEEALAIA